MIPSHHSVQAAIQTATSATAENLARVRVHNSSGDDDFPIGWIIFLVIAALVAGGIKLAWPHRRRILNSLNNARANPSGAGGFAPGGLTGPPPADIAVAVDPRTPPATLIHMVDNAPPLRQFVAANPATDPNLLRYLGTLGDPAVNQALAARGFQGAPPTGPIPPGGPWLRNDFR